MKTEQRSRWNEKWTKLPETDFRMKQIEIPVKCRWTKPL